MAHLSSNQRLWRRRIETGIRIAAPLLDLLLAAGDRLSRAVDREPPELVPTIRPGGDRARALSDGRD